MKSQIEFILWTQSVYKGFKINFEIQGLLIIKDSLNRPV